VSGQHSADSVEYSPNKRQEGDFAGLAIQLTEMRMTVDGSVDLLVIVTILFGNVPQEH
jgi:hypothetical protein